MGMTETGPATSREFGRPHPEERACASAAANQVACARVSKDGAAIIPPHASRRIAAQRRLSQQPSSRAAMLLSMRARARGAFWQAKRRRGREDQPAAVGNDRRLGFPVFGLFFTGGGAPPTCRAVGAPVRRYPASRASPCIFRGAAQRTACSVTSLATRAFRARGAVTACRPKESQGPP